MKNKRYKKQREKGTIRIGDVMFIVTGEEYAEYYAEIERKKYIRRKERGRNISYEMAIKDELPIDILSATPSISVDDEAEKNILIDQMLKAIGQLDETDRSLIQLLFYSSYSLREVSRRIGMPLTTLHRNRERIFKEIKKLMGF
jgi:RNA polymerase sigma factor (sigma-70 family)